MARLSLELKEKLEAERQGEAADKYHEDEHASGEPSRPFPLFQDE